MSTLPSLAQDADALFIYNVNGLSTQPQKIFNATPFTANFGSIRASDLTPQNLTSETDVVFSFSGPNSQFLSLLTLSPVTTTATILAGQGSSGTDKTLIAINTSSASVTVDLTLTVSSGQVLASTTFQVTIGGSAERLSYTNTPVGSVSPYDLSGITPSLSPTSGDILSLAYQTLNGALEPTSLVADTDLELTISGAIASFSSTQTITTTTATTLFAFATSPTSSTTIQLFTTEETVQNITLTLQEVGGGPLTTTAASIAVGPIPPDRIAFSATNANGSDGFVTKATALAPNRWATFNHTAATFNPLGDRSATIPSQPGGYMVTGINLSLVSFTSGTGSVLFTTSTATVENSTLVLEWRGERSTTFSITLWHGDDDLAVTSGTACIDVPLATALAISTIATGQKDGFPNGSTDLPLTGSSGSFSLSFSSFDAGGHLTAWMGNLPPTLTTTLTVSLTSVGGPTLIAGTNATLDNNGATTSHTIGVLWVGQAATLATLTITHDGDNTLGSTSCIVRVLPPPAELLAFSSTAVTGTDGIPTTATTFQDVPNTFAFFMTGTTQTVSITSASYNAAGNLTATSAVVTAQFSATGDNIALPTIATFLLSTTNAINVNTIDIPYTGPNNTTAILRLGVTGDVLAATTATIGLSPPPSTRLAWGDEIGSFSEFNGGDLRITSQQIFNANLFSLNELGNPRVSSTIGTFTLRIAGSPFPSNPAIVPTFVGVGGVWAAGPIVTSTGVTINARNDLTGAQSAAHNGVLQFAWLGSSATTMTLTFTPLPTAPGTNIPLIATTLTVEVCPRPPERVVFSENSPVASDGISDGGLTSTTITIPASSNRTTTPGSIVVTSSTWRAPVTNAVISATCNSMSVNVSLSGGPTAVSLPTVVFGPFTPVTSNTFQMTWTGQRATVATLRYKPLELGISTTATLLVEVPDAVRIAMSGQQGDHSNMVSNGDFSGFNNGVTTVTISTVSKTESIDIVVSSYDAFNWLTATFANSFGAELTTTLTVSIITPGGPTIVGGATAILGSLSATTTHTVDIHWAGAASTTATLLIAHDGDGALGSTSITITVETLPPDQLAWSSTAITGVDGLQGGNLTIAVGADKTYSISNVTIASWNAVTECLAATNANTTISAVQALLDNSQQTIGSFTLTPTNAVSTASISGAWDGQVSTTALLTISQSGGFMQASTITVTLEPAPAVTAAFSTIQGASTGTLGFNGGVLTVTSGNLVTLGLGQYNAGNCLRATSTTITASLNVFNHLGGIASNPLEGPVFTGNVNSLPITLPGEDIPFLEFATTTASAIFEWQGGASTTAIVELDASPLGSTRLTITIISKPDRLAVTSAPASVYSGDSFSLTFESRNAGDVAVPVVSPTAVQIVSVDNECIASTIVPTSLGTGSPSTMSSITLKSCCAVSTVATIEIVYISGNNNCTLATTTVSVTVLPAPCTLAYKSLVPKVAPNNAPIAVNFGSKSCDVFVPVTQNTVVQFSVPSTPVNAIDYLSNPGTPTPVMTTFEVVNATGGTASALIPMGSSMESTTIRIRIQNTSASLTAATTLTLSLFTVSGSTLGMTTTTVTILPFDGFPSQGKASFLGWLANSPTVTPITTAGVEIDPAPKAAVFDTFSNLVTNYIGPIDAEISVNASQCNDALLKSNSGSHSVPSTGKVRETIGVGDFGIVFFNQLFIEKTGVGYRLEAQDPFNLMQSSTTNSFTVIPNTPTQLALFNRLPRVTTAGVTWAGMQAICPNGSVLATTGTDVVVEIQDQFGNHNPNFVTEVRLSVNTFTPNVTGFPQGVVNVTDNSILTVNGRATFANISINRAGLYTLKATSGSLTDGVSSVVMIAPAAPSTAAFIQQPTDVAVANQMTPAPSVQVFDVFGNRTTNATMQVILSNGSLTVYNSSFTPAFSSLILGVATFNDLRIIGTPGVYTLTADRFGPPLSMSATSNTFELLSGADHLAFSATNTVGTDGFNTLGGGSTTVVDGQVVDITFGAFNPAGTLTAVTTGTTFAFSVPPGPITIMAGTSASLAMFNASTSANVTFDYTGANPATTTLTLTQLSGHTLTSTTITITVEPPAPADRLALSTSAENVINPYDASGVATTAILSNVPVSVDFQSISSQLLPTAVTTATTVGFDVLGADGNVHSQLNVISTANVGVNAPVTAYNSNVTVLWDGSDVSTTAILRLRALSGLSLLETRATIQVTPFSTATRLAFITQPTGQTAGLNLNTFRVAVKDDFGNIVSNFTGTVTVSIDTDGSLCGDAVAGGTTSVTILPGDGGIATFTGVNIERTGTHTLRASWQDNSLADDISTPFTISPAVPTQLAFLSRPMRTTVANLTFTGMDIPMPCPTSVTNNLIVQLQDQFGNHNPNFDVSLTLSVNTYVPNVAGAYTSTGTVSGPVLTDAGTGTFANVRLQKAGLYTLKAFGGPYTDAVTQIFEVTHDVQDDLVYRVQPSTPVACESNFTNPIEVEVFDVYDNFVTSQSVQVGLNMLPEGLLVGSTTETVGATTGVAVFSGITSVEGLIVFNPHTILATSGTVTQLSDPFDIVQGPVRVVDFNPLPTSVACDQNTTLTVDLFDHCGNPVTGATVTLTAPSGFTFDHGQSVSTATSDLTGVATFTLSNVHALIGTYTLSAESNSVVSTASIEVTQGEVAMLNFLPLPTTVDCDQSTTLTIDVRDWCGNGITGASVTLTSPAGFTFDGGMMTSTATSVGGTAVFTLSNVHALVGSYTLTVTSGLETTTATIMVEQGIVEVADFNPLPTTVDCAESTTLTVDVFDDCGNPVNGATVTLTAPAGFTFDGGMTTSTATSVLGVATFTLTGVDALVGSYTLTASADNGLTSATIMVTPGAVDFLAFSPLPTTVECDGNTTLTVTVLDACTNPLTGEVITLTAPAGFTFNGGMTTTTATSAAGAVTFVLSNINALVSGSPFTLTASQGAVSTSADITVLQGPVATLDFNPLPTEVACDESTHLTVDARDYCGNPVVGALVTLTAAPGFTFDGGMSVSTATTDAFGVASFWLSNVNALVSGSPYTLTATSGAGSTSADITVLQGAVETLAFSPLPTDVACSESTHLTVDVIDDCGNPVNGAVVTLTASSGFTFDGGMSTSTATSVAGVASFWLSDVDALIGTYTLTVTSGVGTSTATIDVVQGAVATLDFNPLPTYVACDLSTHLTVDAFDDCGNPVTGATVTLTASSGFTFDGGMSTSTATTDAFGVASFWLSNVDALIGTYTLTATSGAGTTSATIDVVQGAVETLAFNPLPTEVACGFSTHLTVDAFDNCGNPVTGATVTLTASAGFTFDGGMSMSTATTDAFGVASFWLSDVDALVSGSPYTLTAVSGSAMTSAPITVTNGTTFVLAFDVEPTTTACNTAFSPTLEVSILDKCGNPVPGRTVTLTPSSGLTLVNSTTAITNVMGVATFTDLGAKALVTGNPYTIEAEADGVTVTSTPFEIATGIAVAVEFITDPGDGVAGNLIKGGQLSTMPVLQLFDACGNPALEPGVPIQVTFENNAGSGTLFSNPAAGLTFTNTLGQATFTGMAVDKAATGYSLKATATFIVGPNAGNQAMATSATFDVTHWIADQLAFSVQPPASSTAATPFVTNPAVEIQDCFGNHVTNATNTVKLAIGANPGSGTLVTDFVNNETAAVGGVSTFTGVEIDKVGVGYTLTASATGLSSAISNGFDITVGAPFQLAFVTEPSANNTAAVAFGTQPVVEVQDAGGNRVNSATTFDVTVSLLDDQGTFETATLFGSVTSATSNAGQTVYGDLNIDKVGTYQLVATASGPGALLPATSAQLVVDYGVPIQVGFNIQPNDGTVDAPFNAVIQVQVEDAGGNHVIQDNDTDVSLSIHPLANPGSTTLVITNATVTTVAGNASFIDPRIIVPGVDYRLLATGVNVLNQPLIPATSNTFTIYPGVPVTSNSTLTADGPEEVTVGGHTISFTAVKRDQFGFITTSGTIDIALIDNGSSGGFIVETASLGPGSTTASIVYTSGTTAGVAVASLEARIAGEHINGSPIAIEQLADVPVVSTSTIAGASTTVEVSAGTNTLVFTTVKRDQFGNVTPLGTIDYTLTAPGAGASASITPVDNGDGTVTLTYFSGEIAGLGVATIEAQIGGVDIVGSPITIDQTPAAPTAANSDITGPSTTVEVSAGTNTLTFTATKRDQFNNVTTLGAINFALIDLGAGPSVGLAPVDNGDGTYTVTYASGETSGVGVAEIEATIGGVDITGSPVSIDQTAGVPVAANSDITGPSTTVEVSAGTNTLTFTATKRDVFNNVTPLGTVDFLLTAPGAGASAAIGDVDNGDGTVTLTYSSGEIAGTAVATINATIGGSDIIGSPIDIDQTPAAPSALTSDITGPSTTVEVSAGANTLAFTATKRDEFGNVTTLGTIDFLLTAPGAGASASLTPVDNGDGTFTVTYASGEVAGLAIATINATIGGADILGSPVDIDQTAGVPVAANSDITGPSTTVEVSAGTNTLTFTATKRDVFNNVTPLGTVDFLLTAPGAGASAAIGDVDNGDGTVTLTYFSGEIAGTAVATIDATIGGSGIIGSPIDIDQTPGVPVAATSDITGPTSVRVSAGTLDIDLTATKRDVFGNVTTLGVIDFALIDLGAGPSVAMVPVDNADGTYTVTYFSGEIAGTAVAQIDATIGGADIIGSPIDIDQTPDDPTHLTVEDATDALFTNPPPVLAEATRDFPFVATLALRDQFENFTSTTSTVTVTLSGSAGATGTFTIPGGDTFATTAVVPTTFGSNLEVDFASADLTPGPLAPTTLTITTVYDVLSLSYDTPQILTRFQPSANIIADRQGGRPGYTFAIIDGAADLAAVGLSFSASTGLISGVPTTADPVGFDVLVRATDFNGVEDDALLNIVVNDELQIAYVTTQTLFANSTPSIVPTQVEGGTPAITYSLVTGPLPPTLTLNTATGEITGVVTVTTGTFMVTIGATDVNGATDNANITFTVQPQLNNPTALNAKMRLQGASNNSTTGTIMTTNLNAGAFVPLTDPYTGAVTVASIPANIVDWVEIEFRTATNATASAVTVAFLRNDGMIVGLDGSSQVLIDATTLPIGDYYVVVNHRNHLKLMSSVAITLNANSSALYDYTASQGQAFSLFQDAMALAGTFALFSGDTNNDGVVNATDRAAVRNAAFSFGYLTTDLNLDTVVNALDRAIVRNNSFRATQVPVP